MIDLITDTEHKRIADLLWDYDNLISIVDHNLDFVEHHEPKVTVAKDGSSTLSYTFAFANLQELQEAYDELPE